MELTVIVTALIIAVTIILLKWTSRSPYIIKPFDEKGIGAPYYEPEPYLLRELNNEGKIVSKIIYLPNREKKRLIERKGIFGKTDISINLENGWQLNALKSTTEGNTKEVLETIGKLLPGLLIPNNPENKPSHSDPENLGFNGNISKELGLFRFEYDEKGIINKIIKL